ncbi:MAG: hydantoinase/oxoprolinase family protein, partial [Gammaproteobacteria bacterium]|nr:hydantoinase/oxoprolinase family protein [Gammaproteobacteria bacterium]
DPCVTDADLVLGYLDPNFFLGGSMKLDKDAAEAAIEKQLAEPLGTTMIESAYGIHDLINETMAAAAKTHIAEKGGNPNVVTLTAFGGAGPVHAYGLAKKIGAPMILVPPLAGVGSALGFFTAPVAFDHSRSHRVVLEDADFSEIETLFKSIEKDCTEILKDSDRSEEVLIERTMLMRFVGQGAETDLSIENQSFDQWSVQEIRDRFDDEYKRLYGRTYPEAHVEFVTFKVRASLPEKPFKLPQLSNPEGKLEDCIKGTRQAFSVNKKEFIPFTVYDRQKLFGGAKFPGPAIIEERESTIVVGEDALVSVDKNGFVWIDLSQGKHTSQKGELL